MKEERKLNIILDNARIHTAKIVKEISEILHIKSSISILHIVLSLTQSKMFGKTLKKDIYNIDYETLEELTILFNDKFYEKVDSTSYYENWEDTFLE